MPSSLISNADTSTYLAQGSSFGIFRGIVVENRDPEHLCRIRVQIPAMTGSGKSGISSEALPWAMPCFPSAGPGYGMALVPDVGTTVWVAFESGDKSKPVWLGCCYGATTSDGYRQLRSEGENTYKLSDNFYTYKKKEMDTPYDYIEGNGDRKVLYKSPKGAAIVFNEADEEEHFQIIDRLGQTIKMYSPVKVEYNEDNQAQRDYGSTQDWEMTDKIMPANSGDSYILIMQAAPDPFNNSLVKLATDEFFVSNGQMAIYASKKVVKILDVEEEQQIINDREKGEICLTNYTFYPNELHEKRKEKREGELNIYEKDEGDVYIKKEVTLKITKDNIENVIQTYQDKEKKLERTFKVNDDDDESISTETGNTDDKVLKRTSYKQTEDDRKETVELYNEDGELLKETSRSQTQDDHESKVDYYGDETGGELKKTSTKSQTREATSTDIDDIENKKKTFANQTQADLNNKVDNYGAGKKTSTGQTDSDYNIDNNGKSTFDILEEEVTTTTKSDSIQAADTSISGNTDIGGLTNMQQSVTIGDSLGVGGPTNLQSTLGVAGSASFAGGVSFGGGGGAGGGGGGGGASGGGTIEGSLTLTGDIKTDGDVIAGKVSLKKHKHDVVGEETSEPKEMEEAAE